MKGKVHKVKEVDVAPTQRHPFGHGSGRLHIAADDGGSWPSDARIYDVTNSPCPAQSCHTALVQLFSLWPIPCGPRQTRQACRSVRPSQSRSCATALVGSRTPPSAWLHHQTATLPHSSRIAGWCPSASASLPTADANCDAVAKFLKRYTLDSASGSPATGCALSVQPGASVASVVCTSLVLIFSRPSSRMAFLEHGTQWSSASCCGVDIVLAKERTGTKFAQRTLRETRDHDGRSMVSALTNPPLAQHVLLSDAPADGYVARLTQAGMSTRRFCPRRSA